MLDEIIANKKYPSVLTFASGEKVTKDSWQARRQEMKELLEKYSYGVTPPAPSKVWGEVTKTDEFAYAGKVLNQKVTISFETEKGVFTFPIELFIPKRVNRPPLLLHIAFRPVPDRYIPVEEITDRGFALAVMVYTDVVNDNYFGDWSDGLAKYFGVTSLRRDDEWGKIGMWAYGASRVMDYIQTRDDINGEKVAVIGHSRLGKTALWCGAQDERFTAVISNNSGYGGARSSIDSTGETISDFLRVGSWDWFCENFKLYHNKENEKPYDQAYLLALIAPRHLLVGSAIEDKGADPLGEFYTTFNASKAWELLGEKGLTCSDEIPKAGDSFNDGKIHYHLRAGRHYLSREDWNEYIDYLLTIL